MIELQVSELLPGMIVCEDVKSKSNQIIIQAESILTRQNISRLKFYGIKNIKIYEDSMFIYDDKNDEEKETMEEPQKEPVEEKVTPVKETPKEEKASVKKEEKKADAPKEEKPRTPLPRILFSPTFQQYQLDYASAVSSIKNTFNDIVFDGKKIDEEKLLSMTEGAFDNTNTTLHLFDMLHNMRQSSDAIFAHSMNVALIASTLGKWLKFPKEDIECLALSGMLHDIGKTYIPKEILDKPGKLTEQEYAQIKRHPILGFNRLKDEEIDPKIKKVALMHHERTDGSGYPHNLVGNEIHPFAMIIAIADVYDAMTSSRTYRSPICPFQVIANFEDEGLQKYDAKFMLTFLERIANTYQNNRVILNDGRSGTIVMLNQSKLSRPIVQLESNQFVDLATETKLYIKAII